MDKLKLWLYWDKEETKSDFVRMCYESIRKHCAKDFEIIETSDKNLSSYLPDLKLPDFKMIQHKADLIRALLLNKYGGIWLDGDTIVLRSIAQVYDLLDKYNIVCAAWAENHRVHLENGIIAAKKEDPIFDLYLKIMVEILNLKGPHGLQWLDISTLILNFIYREFKESIFLLSQEYASPLHWKDTNKYFEDHELKDYWNDKLMFVYGYNALFPKEFKSMERDQLLSSDYLIAKFIKLALK